jgi:predicted RNA-binding protein YlxR (DUF448 family)
MLKKKVPMRRCVATGEQLPKKELLRIVKTPDGEIKVDLSGKANGRGAYLKKDPAAVELAKKKGVLSRALEAPIPEEFWNEVEKAVK